MHGKRVPFYSHKTLTTWFANPASAWRAIQHAVKRSQLTVAIMDQLEVVPRTSELARVFGIDFFSVLSRGSQYRVESMVLRMTKPRNFILVSPSKQQVANQNAPECVPLVMEPLSHMYTSPVLVFDFQSLYPSIIIAYNYWFAWSLFLFFFLSLSFLDCLLTLFVDSYSTCLGRIQKGTTKKFGTSTLSLPTGLLSALEDKLSVSPNEIIFTKSEFQRGVLPGLLEEILETRIMVKKAMKKARGKDKVLFNMLNARQLGLKMIANVTYGYTSASFSGRMPCIELADSIVQTGRQTLERAIRMVEERKEWGARVVYGDTDSLFVLVEGATREEAFRIGQEIAAAVTAANPKPVKLLFEKVYHPCLLVAKKRYVGYKFEHAQQARPEFEAKGIETVRRDSCPAVQKILEKSIRLLFDTKDLSAVKEYLQRQWKRIQSERVSWMDLIFCKEVRLGTYSTKALPPPAAIVASKMMSIDPRAEPRYGERIPYVVVTGGPDARLVDMVISPHVLLKNAKRHHINAAYYINKQIIPALARIFSLVGVEVRTWYNEMPRVKGRKQIAIAMATATSTVSTTASKKKPDHRATIDQYYLSRRCIICDQLANQGLCRNCIQNPQSTTFCIVSALRMKEAAFERLAEICMDCTQTRNAPILCQSLDCAIYFERVKLLQAIEDTHTAQQLTLQLLSS
jgi:DNA polymerase zeta